jgi:hypothetical protein
MNADRTIEDGAEAFAAVGPMHGVCPSANSFDQQTDRLALFRLQA